MPKTLEAVYLSKNFGELPLKFYLLQSRRVVFATTDDRQDEEETWLGSVGGFSINSSHADVVSVRVKKAPVPSDPEDDEDYAVIFE